MSEAIQMYSGPNAIPITRSNPTARGVTGNALLNSGVHDGLVSTYEGWKIQSMFFVNPITEVTH